MDEAGTPFCFTIDGDTLEDQTVTVRDRDTGGQERIALDRVRRYLAERSADRSRQRRRPATCRRDSAQA